MGWTVEQQRAIEQRNANLLISAAAGSGKTAVLVERILQLVLKDQCDIGRMLIVTFTKAAASEMRERIGTELMRVLNTSQNASKHLRKQLATLSNASISTLHAFCMQVVRQYFYLLELDPGFRVADDTEIDLLQQEAVLDAMEALYAEKNADFLSFCNIYFDSKGSQSLQVLAREVYDFMRSRPEPFQWLRRSAEQYNVNEQQLMQSPWFFAYLDRLNAAVEAMTFYCGQAAYLCKLPGGPIGYLSAIEEDSVQLTQLRAALDEGLDAFTSRLKQLQFARLGRCAKEVDLECRERVKKLRDHYKKIIRDLENNGSGRSIAIWAEELQLLYPALCGLEALIQQYHEVYMHLKQQKRVIDYSDLEHFTLELLKNNAVLTELSQKYDYIFVDEYQDSNQIQECIVQKLSRNNNLFMVGDVKQSIYRFRQADPSIFLHKYHAFKEAKGCDIRIDLNKNFRSRQEILSAVNGLLGSIMSEKLGELEYDDKAKLYSGMCYPDCEHIPVGLTVIFSDAEEETQELQKIPEIEDLKKEEIEAAAVASAIKKMHGKPIYDAKQQSWHPAQYRDMVVLMRSVSMTSPVFTQVFQDMGIPTFADAQTGYFDAVEVAVFLNLLRVIDNRHQDIPLLSVLRSSIGDFNEQELAEIRIAFNDNDFCDAFISYAHTGANRAIADKAALFLKKLERWRESARMLPLQDLLWQLLDESGYYDFAAAMPGGRQRRLNLDLLIDKALQFENTSLKGLFNFLRYIERIRVSGSDFGTAQSLGENDDVVRIMSIHKSKGLEFPIVFLAGIGRQFNKKDITKTFMLHDRLGIGAKYIDPVLRCRSVSFAQLAMKKRIEEEMLAEEMRVLYVALTRAKNALYLFGSTRLTRADFWKEGTAAVHLLSGSAFLDWIGAYLFQNKRLVIEKPDMFKETIQVDGVCWGINCMNRQDVLLELVPKEEAANRLDEMPRTCSSQWISDRLEWEYPYSQNTGIPSKVTVTEIKHLAAKQEEQRVQERIDIDMLSLRELYLEKCPAFMQKSRALTSMERGLAVHFALQHLQFSENMDVESIRHQIDGFVKAGMLTIEEAACIDAEKMWLFIESSLGKRLIAASDSRREIPFNLVKRAEDISIAFTGCSEEVMVQGIIDCCFMEEQEWVLIDYKTDAVTEVNYRQVVDRYRVQLRLYREALEMITEKKVKEVYLYLFSINKAVELK